MKIIQSSWNKGINAIVLDPDPIRGEKIVIQAKRYTNIVGVSAVRDLYSIVVNTGTTKGILVTTSDYGTEFREFINNKPLTLINGSELLYLLNKHGYNVYINIKEVKNK